MRKGKGVRMEWIQGCLEGGRQWAGPLETFFCPFQGHAPNFISARTLAFLQQTLGDEKESGREREKLHYLWSPRRLKKKLLSTISGCVKRPFVLRRPPLRNPQTLSPHSSCSLPPPPPASGGLRTPPHPTPAQFTAGLTASPHPHLLHLRKHAGRGCEARQVPFRCQPTAELRHSANIPVGAGSILFKNKTKASRGGTELETPEGAKQSLKGVGCMGSPDTIHFLKK